MPRQLKCTCGKCQLCKKRDWWRANYSLKAKTTKARSHASNFPKSSLVIVWECSDGREFSSEVEALRYELDLFRQG